MQLRRIDHVVAAVHDLDAAGAFYRRLGFQVGARNRHPWGTENRLIQFNHSFIELVTVGADAGAIADHARGHFSFGAFVRDYLRKREGFAMLVLDSADAKADAALFARKGIGSFEPFFFERKGRRPDGAETHLAFTLAFARPENAPDCGFFVCQHHFPENFWNRSFQVHENGARAIVAAGMTAAHPEAYRDFLVAFTGSEEQLLDDGLSIELRGSRLNVSAHPSGEGALLLSSIDIAVPDIEAQAQRLQAAGIGFRICESTLHVPPEAAFGLNVRFVATS